MTLPRLNPPINYVPIRTALVTVIQEVTGKPCVFLEAEAQDSPRPQKPYFGFKFTAPAARMGGEDDHRSVLDNMGHPTTKVSSGGQRRISASFQCFGTSHEETYGLMELWQSALDLYTVCEELRKSGIAVWTIGNVADLSALLNTAYEGRAQMDVTFGVASNLVEDLSEIVTAPVAATVDTGSGQVTENFNLTT